MHTALRAVVKTTLQYMMTGAVIALGVPTHDSQLKNESGGE